MDSGNQLIPVGRIVVVEDDPIQLKFYKQALCNICQFYGFQTGQEALAFIQKGLQIDLIIIDRNLPDIKGEDLCHRLQSYRQNLPIIIISGLNDIDDITNLMDHNNIKTYITKPVSAKILRDHVKVHLRQNSQQST